MMGWIAMVERTRSDGQAGIRPGGAAWGRVQREIGAVAGKTPQQVQRWWLRVEFRDAPATLAGHWKIPLYVDERAEPEGAPCPSD